MAKLKWSDESFEDKVKALIRDHLHPLASDCKEEEDLLALCVAHITAGIKLMHEIGYKQQEIEEIEATGSKIEKIYIQLAFRKICKDSIRQ